MSTGSSIPSSSIPGAKSTTANVSKPSTTTATNGIHTTAVPTTSTGSTGTTTTGSTGTTGTTTERHFKGFYFPEILTWKNPSETGIILAEALGFFVVLGSTLTVRYFLRIASLIIGVLSVAEWGSRYISGQRSGLISSYQPSRFLPLNERVVNEVAQYVSNAFRRVTFGIQHLVDARDPVKGFKLAIALYSAYILLGVFSLKALILTGIVLAFTVPALYLQFKPEVDNAINEAHTHAHQHLKTVHKQIHAKAGPQLDYLKKFVGPRGGFDTTKNVSPVGEVPTAGARPTQFTKGASSGASSTGASSTGVAGIPSTGVAGIPSTGAGIKSTTEPGTTFKSTTTEVPDEVFKHFDTVPTFTGNVPIDHKKLDAALAADKAKAEGAVNGL